MKIIALLFLFAILQGCNCIVRYEPAKETNLPNLSNLSCIVRKAAYEGENTVLQISLYPTSPLTQKAEDTVRLFPIINGKDTLVLSEKYAGTYGFLFNRNENIDKIMLDVYYQDKYYRIPLNRNQDCNAALKMH